MNCLGKSLNRNSRSNNFLLEVRIFPSKPVALLGQTALEAIKFQFVIIHVVEAP
ncbi:hypothetical protein C8R31_10511 [Nitrosospira sp. Nsp2]|nr:hypothetical protein C8R31_10511 [Nitrosospira sp. Nsp2]